MKKHKCSLLKYTTRWSPDNVFLGLPTTAPVTRCSYLINHPEMSLNQHDWWRHQVRKKTSKSCSTRPTRLRIILSRSFKQLSSCKDDTDSLSQMSQTKPPLIQVWQSCFTPPSYSFPITSDKCLLYIALLWKSYLVCINRSILWNLSELICRL